ncbi:MAG: aldehyde dehydrogenase family protein [Gammaproteobacteria bacterium]|nr:aldehyde dehydrogenase family protein [Gammaproteobacteria bacterium]
MADIKKILSELGLQEENAGVWASKSGWLKGEGNVLESINPANGEVIAKVRCASKAEYEKVITEAEALFEEWRKVPAPQRGEAVRLVGEALRKHKDALGSLVSLEMGKIKQEGDGEVQEMIDIADFAVGQSRMMYGLTMHSERPDHRMYEQWHPFGVVGVLTAFNFPVAVWAWNAMLSAIAGNVTVWKPSPKTPLTSIACQNIANEVLEANGFPGIFGLFNDDTNELAQTFVDDERIKLVSFTGSCAIGKQVGHRVAQRMGRSLLELGGNNALIVDETADMKMAIPAIVFGSVGTAGQRCTTTRRVLAHESIIDGLVESLKKAYGQVKIGDPLEEGTLMGPLCDEGSVQRYVEMIEKIKQAGGTIVTGGNKLEGNYVEPAIVTGLSNDSEIVQTETFAPILYVMPFKTVEEAIQMQNAVPQGLSSAIFTMNMRNAEKFLSYQGSDCGIANVNIGTSGAEIGGAFGGEKETGGGRESGSDAWKQYMRRQTNTINWSTELPLAQGIKFDIDV